jgi:ribosomal protein S18 acetylase RimI-like enzyme
MGLSCERKILPSAPEYAHFTHHANRGKMMRCQKENDMLYNIHKSDIPKASAVLADAFRHDPLWDTFFEGESHREGKLRACFESPIRYCYTFGEVYASSENLEGIAAWVPGNLSYMTMWRMIRSGAIWAGIRIGMNAGKKMRPVFAPLERDRKKHMSGRSFIYLLVIGVAIEFQGQGFGGTLLRALIEKSEASRNPIYLETETEHNVTLYEKFGFRTVKRITLPIVNHPMWEMMREPKQDLSR